MEKQEQEVMHEPSANQTGTAAQTPGNSVLLSDGRTIVLREALASDEMIVAGQLGDVFEANGAGSVIFNSCLIARTIVSVDGSPAPIMRNYESVRDFLAGFKGKDWRKIAAKYKELNGDEGND